MKTSLHRRTFLRTAMGVPLVTGVAGTSALGAAPAGRAESRTLVSIHMAAHSFYDEGIDHCLDFLQETASVNTLFITSNPYYGAMFRPKEAQGYHRVRIRDGRGRKVTRIWFKPQERYYAGTTLRHELPDTTLEYAGKEIFADLAEPARKRGMRIYERLYEPGGKDVGDSIRNWQSILTVNVLDEPGVKPCWNNPDYLAWVSAHVTDLFKDYPLDGIQFGAERNGPLSRLIDWAKETPTCFCDFCRARARKEGVDFERTREGLREMTTFIRALERGESTGPDGPLVGFLRILMQYPEILSWENMHYRAGEELHQRLHDAVKAANPRAQVGRHIDHSQLSWDMLYRAVMPFSQMTPSSDFLKLSTYHDILGPRLKRNLTEIYGKHIFRQVPPEQLLSLFYSVAGHDPKVEPTLEGLAEAGLSPEYVYRETKRAVEGVAGKSAVYSGIAIDIPQGGNWGTEAWPSDPDEVYRAVHRAFDAGASGIVICREYEEMREPSLRAVGRAIRDVNRTVS